MPRLIVLNGPPGAGKSTLAQLYIDDHPLALNLDIDRVRAMLGRWQDQQTQAGKLARAASLAMAHTHLSAGHDVVIPQYVGQVTFIQHLEQLAIQLGAAFHELMLLANKDHALRRLLARDARPAAQAQSPQMLARARKLPVLEEVYDRLLEVISARPRTGLIPTTDGQVAEAYQALLQRLRTRSQ